MNCQKQAVNWGLCGVGMAGWWALEVSHSLEVTAQQATQLLQLSD